MMGKQRAATDERLYNKEQYQLLIAERRRLQSLVALCDKAEACGIDVSTYRAMRDEIDKQLEAIQTHFMTPAPTY